ncbi:MAG: hypothetical protein J6N51_10935 [Selenomonas sp.]|nr:hypothetical protein [Selenomonas sp.]MBP3730973.1 hypothetical protein [Mailhella sp.]
MENNVIDLTKKMMEESSFGIVSCKHDSGIAVAVKGNPPQIAFAIALLIKNLHEEGKVPLKEFGSMINDAMAMMLEEGVKI